jgi:hypothetical protein
LSFYQEAVFDIAPWAIDAAIKRWARGEVKDANVDFAPSPGVLRRLCETELEPFKAVMQTLHRLQSAVSIERAMDPTPLPVADAHPSISGKGTVSIPQLKVIR